METSHANMKSFYKDGGLKGSHKAIKALMAVFAWLGLYYGFFLLADRHPFIPGGLQWRYSGKTDPTRPSGNTGEARHLFYKCMQDKGYYQE